MYKLRYFLQFAHTPRNEIYTTHLPIFSKPVVVYIYIWCPHYDGRFTYIVQPTLRANFFKTPQRRDNFGGAVAEQNDSACFHIPCNKQINKQRALDIVGAGIIKQHLHNVFRVRVPKPHLPAPGPFKTGRGRV